MDATRDVAEDPTSQTGAEKPRKKRRRWLRIVLIVSGVLVVLVALLPYLVSTGPGTALVVSIVSGSLDGRIELDDLSIGWGGPITVRGLRVFDAQDRPVLNVKGIDVAIGLWNVVFAWEEFGQVVIDSPEITVYLPDENEPKGQPPAGEKATAPGEPGAAPAPRGRLVVKNGKIRVARSDGRELAVSKLDTRFDFDTLSKIVGNVEVTMAGGGGVALDIDLRELAAGGHVDPKRLAGDVKIRTRQDVAVKPMSDFAGLEPAATGVVRPAGRLVFSDGMPVFRLDGKAQVVKGVRINRDIGIEILSRLNPVFGQAAKLDGTASLWLEDLELPLNEKITTTGRGKGHLDISTLRIKPGGLVGELLGLGGVLTQDIAAVTFSGVDFAFKDGRIHYDNFSITFGQTFDLKFRGSVGFDDTLDLVVSVPLTPAMFRKLKLKGPMKQVVGTLLERGTRVDIPITGTRQLPTLRQPDLESILTKAGGGLLDPGKLDVLNVFGTKRKQEGDAQKDKKAEAKPGLPNLLDILKRPKKDEKPSQ